MPELVVRVIEGSVRIGWSVGIESRPDERQCTQRNRGLVAGVGKSNLLQREPPMATNMLISESRS